MSGEANKEALAVHTVHSPAWTSPSNVSASALNSSDPVVLVGEDGTGHIFWEEDSLIYHARQLDGVWQAASVVAGGNRPAASLAADGTVHLVFSSEFFEQQNVFHLVWQEGTWSLPRKVSKTSGVSSLPAITIDAGGVVHAVWTDMTPGYAVLYHGWLESTWLFEELRNARGSAPSLAGDPKRQVLHVVWQSRGIGDGPQEVFHLQGSTYAWTLPANISLSPNRESLNASVVCDGEGVTHLVWQEHAPGGPSICYVGGGPGNWSPPVTISEPSVEATNPAAQVTEGNQLSVVWQQGSTVVYRRRSGIDNRWRPPELLLSNDNGLEGLSIARGPKGELHMAWGSWVSAAQKDVFHSKRDPLLTPQVFLPAVSAGGP